MKKNHETKKRKADNVPFIDCDSNEEAVAFSSSTAFLFSVQEELPWEILAHADVFKAIENNNNAQPKQLDPSKLRVTTSMLNSLTNKLLADLSEKKVVEDYFSDKSFLKDWIINCPVKVADRRSLLCIDEKKQWNIFIEALRNNNREIALLLWNGLDNGKINNIQGRCNYYLNASEAINAIGLHDMPELVEAICSRCWFDLNSFYAQLQPSIYKVMLESKSQSTIESMRKCLPCLDECNTAVDNQLAEHVFHPSL